MTKDEIKKALECCNSTGPYFCDDCPYCCVGRCRDELITSALNLITEQEKSIQVAQDSILSLAQQNQEYREQQVKQAQIDVLKGLREKYATSGSVNNNWATIIFVDDIDELIEEIKNEQKD